MFTYNPKPFKFSSNPFLNFLKVDAKSTYLFVGPIKQAELKLSSFFSL